MILISFKLAVRQILKLRLFAVINLLGLSLLLFAGIVILVYAAHERSFDRHIPDYQRTFRILGADSISVFNLYLFRFILLAGVSILPSWIMIWITGKRFIVTGVMKDFHYSSLHDRINNFAFAIRNPENSYNRWLLIRFQEGKYKDCLCIKTESH